MALHRLFGLERSTIPLAKSFTFYVHLRSIFFKATPFLEFQYAYRDLSFHPWKRCTRCFAYLWCLLSPSLMSKDFCLLCLLLISQHRQQFLTQIKSKTNIYWWINYGEHEDWANRSSLLFKGVLIWRRKKSSYLFAFRELKDFIPW